MEQPVTLPSKEEARATRPGALLLGALILAFWGIRYTLFYGATSRQLLFPSWHVYLVPWIGFILGLWGLLLVVWGLRWKASTGDEIAAANFFIFFGLFHGHALLFQRPVRGFTWAEAVIPLLVGVGWRIVAGRRTPSPG